MSTFGFLLLQKPAQVIITDKTLNAVVVRNNYDISFMSIGGLLKSKKSKFQKTILKAYAGDTESYRFSVKLDEEIFNLTGYTITAQARISMYDDNPELLFDITIEDGENGSDFGNGIVVLVLPPSVTEDLPTTCNFDIQATFGSTITTLVSGEILTDPDITRP